MTAQTIALDDIAVGERDREDLGDVQALANSIAAVGLLHPVVITQAHDLVAGGRRLAAVRLLGWAEVAVTVVDRLTVEQALRAEADENTCRKPLTPTEALAARDRRVRILAPIAAESRRAHGQTAPGRLDTSPNLGEVSREQRVAKAGAIGTGYSGSTLDKVATIRDAATAPTVRHERQHVPVPEPVREIAKAALTDVSRTGAAVDRAYKSVQRALDRHVPDDGSLALARWSKSFADVLVKLNTITQFTAENIAENADSDLWSNYESGITTVNNHFKRAQAARGRGLRVVGKDT